MSDNVPARITVTQTLRYEQERVKHEGGWAECLARLATAAAA